MGLDEMCSLGFKGSLIIAEDVAIRTVVQLTVYVNFQLKLHAPNRIMTHVLYPLYSLLVSLSFKGQVS